VKRANSRQAPLVITVFTSTALVPAGTVTATAS
jgi:hypothetical protein